MSLIYRRDAEGRERRRVAMTDITERQQAEETLRESEERRRCLTAELLTVQENERQGLPSELHDEVSQALLSLKIHLSSVEKKLLPAYVQKQLGHHSTSMTVDIDGHWISDEGKKDLEQTLRGDKGRPPAKPWRVVK
jgi:PAS domain-containing protein